MKSKLILLVLSIFTFTLSAQTEIEKVTSTTSKSEIEGHIYFLASDELKGRQTGTAENKIAALYLANILRSYGVKPIPGTNSYYQNVILENTSAAASTEFKLDDISITEIFTLKKGNTDYKGKAIFLNYGLEDDYKNVAVKGKYIICYIGAPGNTSLQSHFMKTKEKMGLAKKNGALGVIEICNIDEQSANQLKHYFNEPTVALAKNETNTEDLVYLWINDKKELVSQNLKNKEEKDISLKIQGIEKSKVISQNVIGVLEGTDPKLKEEYIIYSAHYDHVGIGKAVNNDSIYNGARDNAVGTVTVLSAAKNIAKYPTKRSSLFILFTGEEKGLLGSKWYVDHPVLPLDKMVYCFNSDNGGYNDITKATIIGLNRTTAQQDIVKAVKDFGLEAIDDPAAEQGLFDRSDNVNFAAKGIPAPTFSMGFTAFDEEITKYYHQVTDNPDSVDYDYLLKFFRSYVLACRYISNNPKTPFWVDGDKYYEAGKQLYQN